MPEKVYGTRIIVVLMICIFIIVTWAAWRVAFPRRGIGDVPDMQEQMRFLKRVGDRTDAGYRRAEALSKEGRHAEAGYVYLELAGVQKSIFNDEGVMDDPRRGALGEPAIGEMAALHEFEMADFDGKWEVKLGDAYEVLLDNKYKGWSERKRALERGGSVKTR